jgi:hypothetical protein
MCTYVNVLLMNHSRITHKTKEGITRTLQKTGGEYHQSLTLIYDLMYLGYIVLKNPNSTVVHQ